MADYYSKLTKIGPIFRGANGGLSDDMFIGGANSFYYSDNMEVIENSNNITPKDGFCETVLLGTYTESGKVVDIMPLSDGYYSALVFCENKIYKAVLDGTWTITELWDRGGISNYRLCDAEKFAGKIFFSARGKLFYIDYDTAISATSAWSSSDISSFDLNESSSHPLYASDVYLCIGNKNVMQKISSSTMSTMQEGYTMQEDYTIKFINELGGYIRVVADDGGYGSEVHLRDKSKKAASERIPLQGYKFFQSCIYGGYHYLLSDKGLGLLNGYQFYVLKKFKIESTSADRIPNGMCVYDDKLYYNRQIGMFIYGSKNKNYSDVLHMWKLRTDTAGQYYSIETDGRYLYVGEVNRTTGTKSTYLHIYDESSSKCDKGELQTMAYYGTSLSDIKQAQYLRVGYNIDTGYIKIYYRTNLDALRGEPDTWERHELTQEGGLTRNSDMRTPFATTLKLNCRFQWIQFKFELKGYVNNDDIGRKTRLYSADLYYNVGLD